MSYRNSPRCSNCYNLGHTKNHCPRIKERAKEGDAWAIRVIEKQKQANSNRKCSYCSEKGHNKQSCKAKKTDKGFYDKINIVFLEEQSTNMKNHKISIGSLVSYRPAFLSADTKPTIGYVTKIFVEGRVAGWKWLSDRTWTEPNGYIQYERYRVTLKNEKPRGLAFTLKSMSGSGLGYWGDSEIIRVEFTDFVDKTEKYKVVG